MKDDEQRGDRVDILVVDDEADLRLAYRMIFESAGYRVVEAHDGPTALAVCKKEWPRLATVDVVMPGMTGIELIRQLFVVQPALKVLAISGGGSTLHPDDGLFLAEGAGAHQVMEKPVRSEQLLAVVAQLLNT